MPPFVCSFVFPKQKGSLHYAPFKPFSSENTRSLIMGAIPSKKLSKLSCRRNTGVDAPTPSPSTDDSMPVEDTNVFSQLNDDVILCILSYVSYAPFELDINGTLTLAAIPSAPTPLDGDEIKKLVEDYNKGASKLNKMLFKGGSSISPFQSAQYYYMEAFHGDPNASGNDKSLSRLSSSKMFGTLTHVLPLVNKHFRMLSKSNVLWIEAIERSMGLRGSQVMRNTIGSSADWKTGMVSFIDTHADTNEYDDETPPPETTNQTNESQADQTLHESERIRDLISKACNYVNPEGNCSAKEVYRQVLVDHKPDSLPVFSMYYPAVVGEEISIRLFEPRYRLLIKEIMAGRPDQERNGYPLSMPRPKFLFACRSDTWRKTVTCVVEVRRCQIRRDGIADITIVPISWTIMKKLWKRPQSGSLFHGTVLQSPTRKVLPAFCMRTHLILGQSIRIRLFEERYKAMISEVMEGRTDEERDGGSVALPRPQFLFVCNNRFREGDVACVVEVESCRIHNDRSAQVTVLPTKWVLVESMRARRKSSRSAPLYDASVIYPLVELTRD